MRDSHLTTPDPRSNAAGGQAPAEGVEAISPACSVENGDERGATTAPETDALVPWLRLVDALADEAARRMWEQGSSVPAPQQVSAPQSVSRRK